MITTQRSECSSTQIINLNPNNKFYLRLELLTYWRAWKLIFTCAPGELALHVIINWALSSMFSFSLQTTKKNNLRTIHELSPKDSESHIKNFTKTLHYQHYSCSVLYPYHDWAHNVATQQQINAPHPNKLKLQSYITYICDLWIRNFNLSKTLEKFLKC